MKNIKPGDVLFYTKYKCKVTAQKVIVECVWIDPDGRPHKKNIDRNNLVYLSEIKLVEK